MVVVVQDRVSRDNSHEGCLSWVSDARDIQRMIYLRYDIDSISF